MKENAREQLEVGLRRAAVTLVAIAAVVAGTVHASPPNPVVVVPTTDLPALAPKPGDAMLLHESIDGGTVLYIEQNRAARFATFDVTEPLHIKGEGSVHLDTSLPFDPVSPLRHQAELVRFRQGIEYAVLDLPRVRDPKLITAPGLTLPRLISNAGHSVFAVTGPTMDAPPAQDFGPLDTVLSYELSRLFDVKQVRAQTTRSDTGTTFMLTESGLYMIRRPAVEWTHQLMEIPPN
jgi:hypothetical protein